jgi:cell wall assembly regulator SMI1
MPFEKFCNDLSKFYKQRGSELELFSGATEQELKQAEKQLGHKIDPQLRAAWTISNGGANWQPFFARPGFFTGFDFLAIEEALDHRCGMRKRAPNYKDYSEPYQRDSRIQPGWYQDGWLPFASFSGATMLLVMDHSPCASGRSGRSSLTSMIRTQFSTSLLTSLAYSNHRLNLSRATLKNFSLMRSCCLTIRSSRPRIVASATCLRYASTRPPPRCGAA